MDDGAPGGHIHHTDPFAAPATARSPVRRLRGRLPAPVTLWTANGPDGSAAGLTVSSTLIADGEPGRLLGLVDEESDLWAAARAAGRFAVCPLGPAHRQLADRFAGLMPAPGGLFAGDTWVSTGFGPLPRDVTTWAGCVLEDSRPCGWALLVQARIERIGIDEDAEPLVRYRGHYHELGR